MESRLQGQPFVDPALGPNSRHFVHTLPQPPPFPHPPPLFPPGFHSALQGFPPGFVPPQGNQQPGVLQHHPGCPPGSGLPSPSQLNHPISPNPPVQHSAALPPHMDQQLQLHTWAGEPSTLFEPPNGHSRPGLPPHLAPAYPPHFAAPAPPIMLHKRKLEAPPPPTSIPVGGLSGRPPLLPLQRPPGSSAPGTLRPPSTTRPTTAPVTMPARAPLRVPTRAFGLAGLPATTMAPNPPQATTNPNLNRHQAQQAINSISRPASNPIPSRAQQATPPSSSVRRAVLPSVDAAVYSALGQELSALVSQLSPGQADLKAREEVVSTIRQVAQRVRGGGGGEGGRICTGWGAGGAVAPTS